MMAFSGLEVGHMVLEDGAGVMTLIIITQVMVV